jgi:hypothetical protein
MYKREGTFMNNQLNPPVEFAAWIGLDWSDRNHAISLRVEGSQQLESHNVE